MRVLRWLVWLVAVLLLLLSLAAGALWWWSGTEGSLDWTLQRLARTQPLTAEGARGSLRGGIHVDRLAWEQEGLTAEATDVQLEWQPWSLLRATLELNRVHAGSVRVEDRRPPSQDSPRRPEALALPLRVVIDELAIDRFEWVAETPVVATDIAGAYEYNGTQHAVQLRRLRVAGGSYEGNVSLGARGPMPLVATLQGRLQPDVPGGTQAVPLSFSATARGPLEDFQAQVLLESGATGTPASAPAQATVTARITPWAAQPVPQAQADLRDLDVGAFWPQAPRTRLAGQVRLQPSGSQTWALSADLSNALPGPWDKQRLPLEQLRAEGEWRLAGQALVRSLEARLGGGRVQASGQWLGDQGWTVQGTLEGINPAALHTAMAPLPVGGRAQLSGEGEAIAFDVDLRAQGRVAAAAAKGDEVAAALRALELRQATAKGRWADGLLSLPELLVRTADATLQGSLEARPETRAGSARLNLQAPGLRVRADGAVAETSGGGTLRFEAPNVAQAQAWLQRLPGAPEVLSQMVASGNAQAQLAWQGGWRDPTVQATLGLPSLDVLPAAPADGAAAAPWRIRQAQVEVNGRLSSARLQARGQVAQAQRQLGFDIAGQAGRTSAQPDAAWSGQVATLNLSARDPAIGPGPWNLALRRGFELRWAPGGSFEAGAGEAVLTAPPLPARATAAAAGSAARPPASQAVLSWGPVRYGSGQLQTTGRLSGLPLQWIELFGGPQLTGGPLSGDLVFDGEWDATLGQNLRLKASLVRTGGDLTLLADTLDGATTRVRAGVREARVTLSSEGDAVTLALRWDSERAGSAEGRLATRLTRGGDAGWEWPESAPLSGNLRAQLPRIGVWSLLAPPGWRLRGSLAADLAVAGTRSDPQLTGTLSADDLALRSVVDGVELREGRLRARLDGRRLVVQEFVLRGAGQPGQPGAGGRLSATGEGSWSADGLRVVLRAQLEQLRASMRDDRDVTVSGQVTAELGNQGTKITGDLRIDRALIVIPDETAPRLGSDVVVRRPSGTVAAGPAPKVSEPEPAAARPVSVAVDLNLGSDFRVRGRGIDTRLRGTVALTAQALANPRLTGTITTSGGEYRAYGQRLDVERGEIRFTGPIDNPALDILAIRPNLTQRVGVQISGRAQAPFIRLYSEPELSEPEKLSWLVLGRSSASGGSEAALLQQAALALLAARTGGSGPGLASRLGLDELSFGRDQSGGAAVTLGRRFARNFYAAYERSLSGTVGTLFLFYELTQRFTLRAQAGERTAVDLIYTLSYD